MQDPWYVTIAVTGYLGLAVLALLTGTRPGRRLFGRVNDIARAAVRIASPVVRTAARRLQALFDVGRTVKPPRRIVEAFPCAILSPDGTVRQYENPMLPDGVGRATWSADDALKALAAWAHDNPTALATWMEDEIRPDEQVVIAFGHSHVPAPEQPQHARRRRSWPPRRAERGFDWAGA